MPGGGAGFIADGVWAKAEMANPASNHDVVFQFLVFTLCLPPISQRPSPVVHPSCRFGRGSVPRVPTGSGSEASGGRAKEARKTRRPHGRSSVGPDRLDSR